MSKMMNLSICNSLDFTEARDSEWQVHQLGHMQICTSPRQITTPAPHHSVIYRTDALPAAQPSHLVPSCHVSSHLISSHPVTSHLVSSRLNWIVCAVKRPSSPRL